MKALFGFFRKCRAGLITHAVLLLWPWAAYRLGILEHDGNVLAFTVIFTVMGLAVFDFISIFIAAGITARASAGETPVPQSRDFFLGFSVSGGLLFLVCMVTYLALTI